MTFMAASRAISDISIRIAQPQDAALCGPICYRAFYDINTRHNFPPDMPTPEAATGVLTRAFSHPYFYCVVAEVKGRIVGSNCLDERSLISGVGPITVDPSGQNTGVGRQLMKAVLDRARERSSPGVRLVQAAFHNRSLSLYTSLGFDAREPLSCMQGPPLRQPIPGCEVRPARMADLADANRICRMAHGHDREGEVGEAILDGSAKVVERSGRVTGYTTGLAFFGHSVGETLTDLQALIAAAESFSGPGILVPTRSAALFRWCLENGLHVVQPMTLMSLGLYNEPTGAWLPSIAF
jgi:predicted N-acetyltransferase YhbS